MQGEESGKGGDTGRGWGKGRRAERVGTLVEGGVLQGEESGKGGDTGRGWGKGRRAEGGDTGRRWGDARGGERRRWEHW